MFGLVVHVVLSFIGFYWVLLVGKWTRFLPPGERENGRGGVQLGAAAASDFDDDAGRHERGPVPLRRRGGAGRASRRLRPARLGSVDLLRPAGRRVAAGQRPTRQRPRPPAVPQFAPGRLAGQLPQPAAPPVRR